MEPLAAIAAYAHRRFDGVPAPVAAQARRLLLDGISWMVLGARTQEARAMLESGRSDGRVTVVGTGRRAGLLDALFVNTALTQVHDCSDGRRLARRDGGSNHPGRCVIPAALTMAQHQDLSGRELLDLMLMGYDVASLVKVPVPDMEYSLTIAAMMSRLMEYDAATTERALALAILTFPVRSARGLDDTDFDFLAQGVIARAAASAAIEAPSVARLPQSGMAVELAAGFPLDEGSNQARTDILNVYIKPYPCCRALHGAIDLAREFRASGAFGIDDIAGIEVRTGNRKDYLFEPVAPDASYKRCQFSIPYVTACTLLDGDVGEASFTVDRIASADIARLQALIRCGHDPSLDFNPSGFASHFRPSTMTVRTNDGKEDARNTVSPRGSVLNPLSEEELLDKFAAWTGPGLADENREAVIAWVRALESSARVDDLMGLLRPD
jgi:2-methylcitrate dehydratase PrpD